MKKNKLQNKISLNSPLGVRGSFLFLLLISFQFLYAQSPKRELRATWLTTVWQLDWPSVTIPASNGSNDAARQAAITQQKNGLISILDKMKTANMNAVFFQIRSMCDAMYQSSYEPWSSFISSQRGADPGYDPLAFAIAEAHKRGMELHAWLNPYRYSTSSSTHGELPTDYYNTHRDWLLAYDSYTKILNPGYPQVVTQIKKVVGEVVNKYDVDGIVFDDYFYAYGGTSAVLDSTAQRLYKPANKNVNDWRRENVDRMVAAVYDTIQKVKPYVTFGISPFGTWTTDQTVAAQHGITLPAIGTTGNMYAEIYCDPVAWLEQGTVDYVSPQLYWTTYSSYAYGALAPWWSTLVNRFGKQFYSSHSLSALASAAPAAKVNGLQYENISEKSLSTIEQSAFIGKQKSSIFKAPAATNFAPTEIGLQVNFNRSSDINDAPGSVFYAASQTVNTSGFISYLTTNIFTQPALCPAIGWKSADNQTLVDNLNLSSQTLTWTYNGTNLTYAIYAIPNAKRNDPSVFSSSKYLLGLSYTKQYTFPATINSTDYKIAVTIVDRYGNEFSARVMGESLATSVVPQLVYPADNSSILFPTVFQWNNVVGADSYVWQLARDAQFTDLVCSRDTKDAQFFSGLQTNIKDNVQYFWRVKAHIPNAPDTWSTSTKLSGHKFHIIYPVNGSTNVEMAPVFEYDNISPSATYTLEISTSPDFSATKQVYKQTVQSPTLSIPTGTLVSSTSYYARVSVTDGLVQATSETITFKTLDLVIGVPSIISPVTGSTLMGKSIEVCWGEQASKGFRVELSKDVTFPARSTTVKSVDAYTFCTTYDNLTTATYYIRVKATTNTGLTDPSSFITVNLNDNTGVESIQYDKLKCYVRSDGNTGKELIVHSDIDFSATLSLFSLTGIQIFKIDRAIAFGDNSISLNLKNLPSGLYTLLIQFEQAKFAYKIVF